MNINRRKFICLSSTTLGGLYLLKNFIPIQLPINANSQIEHFFVLLIARGGMDVTLGLDPQFKKPGITEKDLFIEYRDEDILKKGNLLLGPAAQILISHFDDLAIINGINNSMDRGHDSNLNYAMTGDKNNQLETYPYVISNSSEAPLGILTNTNLSSSPQGGIFNISSITDNLQNEKKSGLIPTSKIVFDDGKLDLKSRFLLNNDTKLFQNFNEFLKTKNGSTPNDFLSIAAMLKLNYSNVAYLDLSNFISHNNLDSHANHPINHFNSQKEIWNQVDTLFKLFKSVEYKDSSLFKHTTFLVLSEFSRTPYLNSTQGKDHNPFTNSFLLAGKNIKGNQVFGESVCIPGNNIINSTHTGAAIEFKNQNFSKNESNIAKKLIQNENIAKTIYEIFGLKTPDELANFNSIKNIIL